MARFNLPANVAYILEELEGSGFESYCVGGCVRDVIRGSTPHDWDIATSATPDDIKQVFNQRKTIDTGIKHGTVTLLLDGGQYEITTFRIDGKYTDGRHPDGVVFANKIVDDLARRDFTINAMAYSPVHGLRDPFNGGSDIRSGVIRCVRDPYLRFSEDGLRIMRAMRFASTFGFRIDPFTANAMHMHKDLLDRVSKERINAELSRMLIGVRVKDVLMEFGDVMSQIIPQIDPCIGFEQKNPYHYLQVWEHTALATSLVADGVVLRLAMLLHDIGKPVAFTIGDDGVGHYYGHPEISAQMAEQILTGLRYDRATIDRVVLLVRNHDATIAATPRSVKRWLNRIGESGMWQLLDIKRADAMAQVNPEKKLGALDDLRSILSNVVNFEECFSVADLAINGHDILSLGILPGPEVGNILRFALDMVIDGEVSNIKEDLMQTVEKKIKHDESRIS